MRFEVMRPSRFFFAARTVRAEIPASAAAFSMSSLASSFPSASRSSISRSACSVLVAVLPPAPDSSSSAVMSYSPIHEKPVSGSRQKATYDKDIKGSVLIRTDDVELKNLTVDGDLIIGCGAADGKIVLDNVTVKGRLLVWGGGTKAVYCNAGTNMPAVVVARVDDAVKVIYDRDSTLAVIDTIKTRITERAKQNKETEIIFYDVSGLREAQKQLNAIVAGSQLSVVAPAHLYAIVGATDVKAEFTNNSKSDTYKIEIRRNKDNTLIADTFELAAGKSISSLTLLETPEFGNVDCTVTISAYRDGKQIGTLNTELTLHTAYLWPKEVQ